jgi:coronin-1B/1C/6
VLRLSRTGVEAMRVEVPRRKAYRDFMEDLYPPTRAEGAAMSAPEYFAGRDAEPVLGPVRPLAAELSTSRETAERAGAEVQAEAEEEHEARRVRDAEDARLAERHEDLDKRFSKFLGYQAKLKFAKVTQATRDESCYNLAPDSSGGGADGVVLAASARLFVVPWKAAAGPVYVGDATRAGKHPSPVDATVVHGHRQAVTSVCANEFEDLVFATGSEDCQVRVWRFPEGGVASKEQAEAAVAGSGLMQGGHRLAVRGLGFHRVAAGLLCSFGADVSCKIWDVAAGTAALDLDPDRVLQNAAVSSADWSYQGSELVLAGRDSVVRIADPRAGTCVASFAAHDGVKSMRAVWLGAHPVVCSTGFGKTGDRQFRLWDVRNVAKPLSTTALDGGAASMQAHYVEDNGALVLWAKGELSVRIFELEGAAPDLPASRSLDVGRAKRAVDKFALHACTEFRASGEPSAVSPAGRPCALTPRVRVAAQALAFLPRRCVDPYKAEWLRAFRLTSSAVEALSFSVPRAQDLQSFFADDLFPPARSGVPGQDAQSWLKGGAGLPLLRDLNAKKLPLLSQRPVEQALEKVKRGVQNTDRFRKEQEEAEAKKRQQQEALDRMQRLAVQHEAYNPNLSKPGSGHDGAGHAVELGPKDVEDEEWGD